MRKLLSLLACLLWCGFAQAQMLTTHAGGAGTIPYVGPADAVPSVIYCFSARACSTAAAAGHVTAMTIQRTSDNATQALTVLSNGDLDVATATTFCNATTCKVRIWNDQITGTCAVTQTTQANQPVLSFNFTGTVPSVLFSNANTTSLSTSSCLGNNQPLSFAVVTQVTSFPSTPQNGEYFFGGSGPSPIYAGLVNAGTAAKEFASSAVSGPTVSTGVKHSIGYVFNSSSSIMALNGVSTTGLNPGSNSTGNTPYYLGNLAALASVDGHMPEIIIASVAWSTGQLTTICNNQRLYWGTTGSC